MTKSFFERDIILCRYRGIPETDFHGMIVFFESYEAQISLHTPDLYEPIFQDYISALDKAGHYHKYFKRIDQNIQQAIQQPVFDKTAFAEMIYKKAYAAHYMMQWSECTRILTDYIGMEPREKKGRQLFVLNQKRLHKSKLRWFYGLTIAMLLAMCSLLLVEILVVDAFMEQFQEKVEFVRNALLIAVISLLLGFELCSHLAGLLKYRKAKRKN